MFKITDGKGFHVSFPNGWTVSTQLGPANYCDNYDEPINETSRIKCGARGSTTVEIAWWGPDGNIGENIEGYQSAEQFLSILNKVAAQ